MLGRCSKQGTEQGGLAMGWKSWKERTRTWCQAVVCLPGLVAVPCAAGLSQVPGGTNPLWGHSANQSWGPSAGVLVPELGSKSAEQGQGSSSLQGALPGTHRNCWWCQPFAVAASHPEAGLEPSGRKAPKCMAPGELTPGDASCVESHSWVLVLPSPLPELSSLFQPDVPAPQVATATVKPRPAPHVHLQNPKVFQAFCLPA